MHPLLNYSLKLVFCSGILTGYYWLFLRNQIFNRYNRFYLLMSVALAFLLPFIQFEGITTQATKPEVFQVLQAINGDGNFEILPVASANTTALSPELLAYSIYALGCLVLITISFMGILRVIKIRQKYPSSKFATINLIYAEEKGTPFSFFSTIYWNSQIDLTTETGQRILAHEMAHVKQKHSYDQVFLQLVLAAAWFNPFFWVVKKELTVIHEFLADEQAVEKGDTAGFAQLVLQAAYPQHSFLATSHFFYSSIKRRITMIQKRTTLRTGYISRLFVLPVIICILAAFTLKAKQHPQIQTELEPFVVVIDAGHGGKDGGAISGQLQEKDLCLAIAKKVNALNQDPNLKIILSRTEDIYMTPQEKVNFANASGCDLLITIHHESAPSEKTNINKNGLEIFVARNEFGNAAASKIAASAFIHQFSNNYPLAVTKQPFQRDKGIWILQQSKAPAILLSPGYMSNKKDLNFISSEAGQGLIAQNILASIASYRSQPKTVAVAIKDTVPQATMPSATIWADVNNKKVNIDISKALYVLNGKIIGNQQAATQHLLNGKKSAQTISWLAPEAAIKKYGAQAKFGACEIEQKTTLTSDTLNFIGNTQTSKSTPLYVIDGKIASKDFNPDNLTADQISKINVLKGDAATALYGAAGKNGVIEIFTKAE